jgi:uncharacterized protein YukE
MTASVLDSLVLEFGLDHRPFTKGQREVLDDLRKFQEEAEKAGTKAEQGGRRVADVMASFRREAIGLLGLFLGGRGVKEFVGYMTNLDASTLKAAQTLNMTTRELSAWHGVMEQSGGSAENMTSALQGMTQDMNKFMLTGQGTLASVLRPLGISLFDNNKQLKSAGQLMLELSDAVKGMDPARATAFLSMIPGMNSDSISLILRGRTEMEEMLRVSRALGGTTEESAAAARRYQQDVANLDRSMQGLGRTLLTLVAPALTTVANGLTKLFSAWNTEPGSAKDLAQSGAQRGKLVSRFGSPRAIMEWLADHSPIQGDREYTLALADKWYGPKGADEMGAAKASLGAQMTAGRKGTPAGSAKEMEDYIRQAAVARRMDPDVAVQVAKDEGMFRYVGDRGSSFGPFQLHYGGMAGGGMAQPGLGDEFTKKTGLDARDESTWRQQVDFSLDKASAGGWGPWHGWKGAQFAGIGGRSGGSSSTKTVTVGTVNVYTQATDAKGIAADIKPQLERGSFTNQFNGGLE